MPRLEAIAWDLDGTLVDSAPDLATALNAVLDMRGFMPLSLEAVRGMIGNGVYRLVERGFNAVGIRLDKDQLDRLVVLFRHEYHARATALTRPYPGIVPALEQLRAIHIPMGVCTNKPEALSRQILEGLGLARYFSSVVGGDTTSAIKPDPLPLMACLSQLVAKPRNSLMIGDSAVDVAAARAAGAATGVVPWGYARQPADQLGADFILSDPLELPAMLEKIPRPAAYPAH